MLSAIEIAKCLHFAYDYFCDDEFKPTENTDTVVFVAEKFAVLLSERDPLMNIQKFMNVVRTYSPDGK